MGFFTNFYGLLDLWSNRGSWYLVSAEQLPVVLENLRKQRAFMDEMGVDCAHIKLKAYTGLKDGEFIYHIKVPKFVFKNLEYDTTEAAKLARLGIDSR